MEKGKPISKQSLKEDISAFYLEEFESFLFLPRRTIIFSVIQILIYNLQLASFAFLEKSDNLSKQNDQLLYGIYQIIIQFKGWQVLETVFQISNAFEILAIAQTVINAFVLATILMNLVFFISNRSKQNGDNNKNSILQILKKPCQLLNSLHHFCLSMPFQHSNFQIILNGDSTSFFRILALVNTPLSFLLGCIIVTHDYTYRFSNLDLLSRKYNSINLINYLEDSVMCLLAQSNLSWSYIVFGIFLILRIYTCIFKDCYYSNVASKINVSMITCSFSLWVVSNLIRIDSIPLYLDGSLCFITLVPLQIVAACKFINLQKQKISEIGFNQELKDLSAMKVDQFCRFLSSFMDMDGLEYAKDGKGIVFEQQYIAHISSCTLKYCFCRNYTEMSKKDEVLFISPIKPKNQIKLKSLRSLELTEYSQSTKDKSQYQIIHRYTPHGPLSLTDQEHRYKFMGFLISSIYKEFLEQHSDESHENQMIHYSYLYFIIEVMKIPTKAFVETVEMKNKFIKGNKTIKDIFEIRKLMNHAQHEFSSFWVNSKIQNQRLNLMAVIDFFDLSSRIQKNIELNLQKKKELLLYLNNDFVDLQELDTRGQKFTESRDNLQKDIQRIFDINPSLKQPIFFAEIFQDNFDFKKASPISYAKNSKLQFKQIIYKEDLEIQLFTPRSLMVYITLLHPIGIVKRVSPTIEEIYGVKQEEIIGKSCNFMMPDSIASIHDDCLNLFVEKGDLHNLKKGIIFGFGKYKNGFMFALHSRIKMIQERMDDFGVIGFFKEVNMKFDYFLTSTDGIAIDITERIYNKCFQEVWKEDKKKIEGLDTCKLIPMLGYFFHGLKQEKMELTEWMLMCIPKSSEMMSDFRKESNYDAIKEMPQLLSRFQSYDQFMFLEVDLRFEQLDTAVNVSLKFLEIVRFRVVKKETDILERLNFQKRKLERLLQTKLNVEYNPILNSVQKQVVMKFSRAGKNIKNESSIDSEKGSFQITQEFEGTSQSNSQINNQLDMKRLSESYLNSITLEPTEKKIRDINFVEQEKEDQHELDFLVTPSSTRILKRNQGKISLSEEDQENQCLTDLRSRLAHETANCLYPQRQFCADQQIELTQQTKPHGEVGNTTDKIKIEDNNLLQITKKGSGSPLVMQVKENTIYTNRQEETITSFIKNPNTFCNFQLIDDAKTKSEIPTKITNIGNDPNGFSGLYSPRAFKDITTNSPFHNNEIILLSNESVFDANKNKSSSKILSTQVHSQIQNSQNQIRQSLNSIDRKKKRDSSKINISENIKIIQEKRELLQNKNHWNLDRKKTDFLRSEDVHSKHEYDHHNNSNSLNYMEGIEQKKFIYTAQVSQSSIGSSSSDLQKKTQALIRVIMGSTLPQLARMAIFLGYTAGWFLLLGCLSQFILTGNKTNRLHNNQVNQETIPAFINDFLKININVELMRYFTAEVPQAEWNNLSSDNLFDLSHKHLVNFRKTFNTYLDTENSVSGQDYLSDQILLMVSFHSSKNPYGQPQIYEDQLQFIMFVKYMMTYTYRYIINPGDNLEIQSPVNSNQVELTKGLIGYLDATHSESISQLSESTDLIQVIFVLICLGSFLSFSQVLVLNYSVEKEKEEILKLICTYPPDKLAGYLERTQACLNQTANREFIQQNNLPKAKQIALIKHHQYLAKGKKKTISESTTLPKISVQTVFIILGLIVLVLFEPSFVYVLDKIYLSRFSNSLNILYLVGMAGVRLAQNFSTFFTLLNIKRMEVTFTDYPDYFQDTYSKELFEEFQAVILQSQTSNSELQILLQRIQDNQSISDSDRVSFTEILDKDICQKLPYYLNDYQDSLGETYPRLEVCSTGRYDSLLKQGMLASFHELFRLFKFTLPLFELPQSDFQAHILAFNREYSFSEMRKAFDNLDVAINIIGAIMSNDVKNNSTYFVDQNAALFIFQGILLVSLYSLLWYNLLVITKRSFFKVKYILSFFSIEQILENSYIFNYLSKCFKIDRNS